MWPQDVLKIELVPIKKKKNAVCWRDFQIINLISYSSKVELQIWGKQQKKQRSIWGEVNLKIATKMAQVIPLKI